MYTITIYLRNCTACRNRLKMDTKLQLTCKLDDTKSVLDIYKMYNRGLITLIVIFVYLTMTYGFSGVKYWSISVKM
jgi:hypothetical protein